MYVAIFNTFDIDFGHRVEGIESVPVSYQINVKSILAFFGGTESTVAAFHLVGYTSCTFNTVKKMRDRKRIPIDKLLLLKAAARSQDKQFSIDDHIEQIGADDARPE